MSNKLLLKATHIKKTYGDQMLFDIENLEIFENDRIGLIGNNGVGKSTLLKILANQLPSDTGSLDYKSDYAIMNQPDGHGDDLDYNVSSYKYHSIFEVFQNQGLSGGESTRKNLSNVLSKDKPLLFIDEPTTNLDMTSITNLEQALLEYQGAFVLVSHDKDLINKVCDTLWVVDNQSIRVFKGNYDDWLNQQQREHDFSQFEYEDYQKNKKRMEIEARKIHERGNNMLKKPRHMGSSEAILYKHTATVQQENVQRRGKVMLKRLSQFDVKERPDELPEISGIMFGNFDPIRSELAIEVTDLSISYDDVQVLKDASFTIPSQSKTVLIGDNGSGKSSIINQIMTQNDAIRVSPQANIGYFSQNQNQLDPEKTVLENIMATSSKSEGHVRIVLANLLFSKTDIFKKVSVLSGGEKAKTELARLLVSDTNFLILDEPTNHFDLVTKTAILLILKLWQGTLLLISHERSFIESIATRLLIIQDRDVITFEGTYEEYIAS